MQDWLVILIKARQYDVASENVRNQEAEFYCPRALVRRPRTHLLRPEPLFPGYAFARPRGAAWMFLRSTRGVQEVLMGTYEMPGRVPTSEIDKLRAREGPDTLVRLASSEFCPGESLRVEEGAFVGLEGLYDGMASRDRVYVLLRVFGRQVRTGVPIESVSRA